MPRLVIRETHAHRRSRRAPLAEMYDRIAQRNSADNERSCSRADSSSATAAPDRRTRTRTARASAVSPCEPSAAPIGRVQHDASELGTPFGTRLT